MRWLFDQIFLILSEPIEEYVRMRHISPNMLVPIWNADYFRDKKREIVETVVLIQYDPLEINLWHEYW